MLVSKTKNLYNAVGVWIMVLLTFLPFSAQAANNGIWAGLGDCRVEGDCSITDLIRLGTNIFQFMLGIVGSLALLAFIYGGILFLVSGGNTDTIEKGKNALKGATIGLIIVFASYAIVYFVAQTIGIEGSKAGDIFQTGGFFE